MLLLKSPQFLPNDNETRSKLSTNEYLILTEFHYHLVKIVDFLIKAIVLPKSKLGCPGLYLYNKNVLEYAQIARNETESKILWAVFMTMTLKVALKLTQWGIIFILDWSSG